MMNKTMIVRVKMILTGIFQLVLLSTIINTPINKATATTYAAIPTIVSVAAPLLRSGSVPQIIQNMTYLIKSTVRSPLSTKGALPNSFPRRLSFCRSLPRSIKEVPTGTSLFYSPPRGLSLLFVFPYSLFSDTTNSPLSMRS